jgi:hypothetical protein
VAVQTSGARKDRCESCFTMENAVESLENSAHALEGALARIRREMLLLDARFLEQASGSVRPQLQVSLEADTSWTNLKSYL